MKLKIAVLPGDGIGPEVIQQAVKVMKAVAQKFRHEFSFTESLVGAVAIDQMGNPLPDETLQNCKNSDAILFGTIGDPKYDHLEIKNRPEQGLLKLRKELGLYANIRPISAYKPLMHRSPVKEKVIVNTDFVIYRELNSGIYYGDKHTASDNQSAFDTCYYHADEIDRIAHLAFKAAKSRRKKLTLVDKSNVMETSRLWRNRVQKVSESYPEVKLFFLHIDNAAMQLIINPRKFDVILTENLFGDILSDEASIISGSIGLSASASIGNQFALFEPIHSSYTQYTGKNIANPLATILSAALLLEHFNLYEEADAIRNAVDQSIEYNITTPDLNSTKKFAHTSDIGEFISDYIIDKKSVQYDIENIDLGQSTII